MESKTEDENTPQNCLQKVISRSRVIIIAILLILSQSLQVVSFKRIGYSLGPYPYFILLAVSGCFVPIFAAIVLFIRITGGPFIKEIVRCKYIAHYCVVGVLNSLNGVLVIFSNPHVRGIMQALLTQTVIPWTLLLSCVYLKSRFTWTQYVGAFVATAAIAFAGVGNSILAHAHGNYDPHPNKTTTLDILNLNLESVGSSGLVSTVIWTLIFGIGQVPLSFSGIYQEKTFRQTEVNVFYMLFWASMAQFVTLVALLPANFIPWFGGLSPHYFLDNMESAVMCVAYRNTTYLPPLSRECSVAALDLFLCVTFMFLSTLLQTMMVKYSSAALSVMAITLVTPVSAFAFTLTFLLGSHVEVFTWIEWIALFFLMAGIITYRQNYIREALCPRQRSSAKHADNERPLLMEAGGQHGVETLREVSTYGVHPRSVTCSCHELDGEMSYPRLLNTRGGIITSEYTADSGQALVLYRGVRKRRNTF